MTGFAQNNTSDVIVKHNGDRLNVKIISVNDNISFTYPNETSVNAISKNCVKEIDFSTGRVEHCSDKIFVSGEGDWEKVIITNNPDDIKGLVRKGEVSSTASNTWNFSGKAGVDKKATMKIKKEAAALRAHIIFIQDQEKKNGSLISGATSSKSGVAYGYE